MRRLLLLGVSALVLVACGHAPESPKSASDPAKEAADVRAFAEIEDEILRDLATIDGRIARRARIEPREEDQRRIAMAAVLREDPTVAIVDGAIDPFSFDARSRGLDAIRAKLQKIPPRLPQTAKEVIERPLLERELVARLVDEEASRLEEERLLPRAASALVRAVVEGWHAPKNPKDLDEQDRWLARRLGELGRSLKDDAQNSDPTTALDLVRARELDDALDALEHFTPGFTKSTQELVRIREALEAKGARPLATRHSEWPIVARRARVHLGITSAPEQIERDLSETAASVRARAETALKTVDLRRDALAARLSPILFAEKECIDAVPGSRIRSMAATPERTPACRLRHFVADAQDDVTRALALVAMHEHVIVAQWALAVATGTATLEAAQNKYRLLSPPTPDVAARLERIALARPVAAIGAGEAVHVLEHSAGADTWEKAAMLKRFGDVPLDIAMRELRPRE
jgi:hypothetical protein